MPFNLLVPSIPRLQPARSVKFRPISDGSSRYKDSRREQGAGHRARDQVGTGRRERGAGRLVSNRMAFNLLVPSSKGLQPARSVKFRPISDGSSRYKDLLRGRGAGAEPGAGAGRGRLTAGAVGAGAVLGR